MRPIPAAILACFAVYIVVVAGGHSLLQGVSDPGGDRAIRLMFQIGPLCALVGALVTAIVTGRRLSRGKRTVTAVDETAAAEAADGDHRPGGGAAAVSFGARAVRAAVTKVAPAKRSSQGGLASATRFLPAERRPYKRLQP